MENNILVESERATDFQSRLVDILNNSALSFMISIGHRTGLFDTLSGLDYATSHEIAEKSGLNERYLREWLGAMVTGGIIDYDGTTKTFRLPDEHSASLTRKAGADNLSVFMQYFSLFGEVEDDILTCFSNGGGVPYSRFRRFHEIMAEDSGQSVLSSLESHILPLVPGIRQKLEQGIRVLDIGCGSGRIVNRLSSLFPNSWFTGIDLSHEAIGYARREASKLGLGNTEFIIKDLSDFDETAPADRYDFVTSFDAIHDQAKPLNVLKGIFRTMKSDGVYLMQDISGTGNLEEDRKHLIGPFLYTVSCMHCMTVSLAQGGEGVGAMWGEDMIKDYLRTAGFTEIIKNKLDHDIQNYWYVVRK
jgi:2-polyprenyl-3-methyl-5-hydroxy-6-metoxy-1,4-benzoquinol methylase